MKVLKRTIGVGTNSTELKWTKGGIWIKEKGRVLLLIVLLLVVVAVCIFSAILDSYHLMQFFLLLRLFVVVAEP